MKVGVKKRKRTPSRKHSALENEGPFTSPRLSIAAVLRNRTARNGIPIKDEKRPEPSRKGASLLGLRKEGGNEQRRRRRRLTVGVKKNVITFGGNRRENKRISRIVKAIHA